MLSRPAQAIIPRRPPFFSLVPDSSTILLSEMGISLSETLPYTYPMVNILSEVGFFGPEYFKKTYPMELFAHKVGHLSRYKNFLFLPYGIKRKRGGYFKINSPHLIRILFNRVGAS